MLKLKHFSIVLLATVISILASNVYAIHLTADLSGLDRDNDHMMTVGYSLVLSHDEKYTFSQTQSVSDFIKNSSDFIKKFDDKFANKTPTDYSSMSVGYKTPSGNMVSCYSYIAGAKNVHLSFSKEGGCSITTN